MHRYHARGIFQLSLSVMFRTEIYTEKHRLFDLITFSRQQTSHTMVFCAVVIQSEGKSYLDICSSQDVDLEHTWAMWEWTNTGNETKQ